MQHVFATQGGQQFLGRLSQLSEQIESLTKAIEGLTEVQTSETLPDDLKEDLLETCTKLCRIYEDAGKTPEHMDASEMEAAYERARQVLDEIVDA